MTFFSKIKSRRRMRKLEKCYKSHGGTGDNCPGKASKNRDFCYVEEQCFNCPYWTEIGQK